MQVNLEGVLLLMGALHQFHLSLTKGSFQRSKSNENKVLRNQSLLVSLRCEINGDESTSPMKVSRPPVVKLFPDTLSSQRQGLRI